MSDPEDLDALNNGDHDLINRDFRDANLSNADYSERDFSEAHIENARFDRSNLRSSVFSRSKNFQSTFNESNLSNVVFSKSAISHVSFKDAILKEADFSRSIFSKCDFSNCDLSGANFQNAYINEGCNFENSKVSSNTLFDGASIFRPLSKLPAFRFYKVERGKLVRRTDDEKSATANSRRSSTSENTPTETAGLRKEIRDKARQKIAILEKQLDSLYQDSPDDTQHGRIGHNNPPVEVPLERNQVMLALQSAREIVEDESAEDAFIEKSISKLTEVSITIFRWAAKNLDATATEFSKQIGKTLASKPIVSGVMVWLGFSEELRSLGVIFRQLLN